MGVWRASSNGRSTRGNITEEMLRALRAEGITCAEMAKRLDIPLGTVGTLLTKYGLSRRRGSRKATTDLPKPKPKPNPVQPKPVEEKPKASALPAEEKPVNPIVFPKPTPELVAEIRRIYPTMPRTAAARQLGIPKTQLIHYAMQLGLKSGGVRLGLVGEDDA